MNAADAAEIASVDFQTEPARYRHWQLQCDGPVATLLLVVAEDGGLRPGYQLKLNSYDLGVDVELNDALNRIRFEHPDVRCVVLTSGQPRVFCSGANIFMLAQSSHAWKVNFCKFTNETRNAIEDASAHSGLKFIAAVNGNCAGGGYELALACDEIHLIDDRSSTVSLPEVPLLAVLPGTGGLTRLTDKRRVRHDLADIFCTTAEGVRGARARQWRLVDVLVKPEAFAETIRKRALELSAQSDRPRGAHGVALAPLARTRDANSLRYSHVTVELDRTRRLANVLIQAPRAAQPATIDAIVAAGAAWWPLTLARELDDAILSLRTNEPEVGIWLLRTKGEAAAVLAADQALLAHREHWFVRETIGFLRRTLARLDVSSRTLFALIEPGSCFAGTLLELALAADRSYMLASVARVAANATALAAPAIVVTAVNEMLYPMLSGQSRLARRFHNEADPILALRAEHGIELAAARAEALGLVTAALDEIDWADEIRIVLEERARMSPDALSGLEANLRFGGAETMTTRIFGRLSAWQNWIFSRPNATGDKGALKLYGKGERPHFDWRRV